MQAGLRVVDKPSGTIVVCSSCSGSSLLFRISVCVSRTPAPQMPSADKSWNSQFRCGCAPGGLSSRRRKRATSVRSFDSVSVCVCFLVVALAFAYVVFIQRSYLVIIHFFFVYASLFGFFSSVRSGLCGKFHRCHTPGRANNRRRANTAAGTTNTQTNRRWWRGWWCKVPSERRLLVPSMRLACTFVHPAAVCLLLVP